MQETIWKGESTTIYENGTTITHIVYGHSVEDIVNYHVESEADTLALFEVNIGDAIKDPKLNFEVLCDILCEKLSEVMRKQITYEMKGEIINFEVYQGVGKEFKMMFNKEDFISFYITFSKGYDAQTK